MERWLFYLVGSAVLLNSATMIFSIVRPDMRVWPPPGKGSWQYRYNGIMNFTSLVGFVSLGLLGWNSFVFDAGMRLVGGILFVACSGFALWGYVTLGVRASQGLGEELVTTGPYRYSRNPQYVGTIPALIGYAILCNSGLALAAGLLIAAGFVLVPFAEEGWCRENLGEPYDAYATRVPRFLGVPRS